MDYTSDDRISSSFMTPAITGPGALYHTPVQKILVQANRINFYDSAFFDFSAFATIASLHHLLPVKKLNCFSPLFQPFVITEGKY